ncbi:hypothetical protein Tco_0247156 [Tanacetum coccineum]
MFESGTYKSHPEHVALYESLEASIERANQDEFLAEKDKSRKRRCDDQDPPPPPPDSDLSKKKRHDTGTSGSKQPPAPQSFAWKTSDTREAPSSSSNQKSVPHSEQPIEDVPIPNDMNISDSEANALSSSYQDPDEYKILRQTGDMSSFINWFCIRIRKKKLSKADLEGSAFKCHLLLTDQVDLVNPEGHRVVPDVSKPLSLGGPPGQVTIQTQYFFNKDLEYLVSGDKGRRSALSIYKLKAAQYLDFGLEELVPSLWIESECDYDISDAYVRSHMRILSVVSLKTYERYRSVPASSSRILDKLDQMVKDFKLFKYNPGMETRIWSKDDRKRMIPKYHSEDGNPARANIKQALGSYKDKDGYGDTLFQQSQVHNRMLILNQHLCRNHESSSKGFNASANSDINFFLSMSNLYDTRPQDSERSQDDDQRLDLADDQESSRSHIKYKHKPQDKDHYIKVQDIARRIKDYELNTRSIRRLLSLRTKVDDCESMDLLSVLLVINVDEQRGIKMGIGLCIVKAGSTSMGYSGGKSLLDCWKWLHGESSYEDD